MLGSSSLTHLATNFKVSDVKFSHGQIAKTIYGD